MYSKRGIPGKDLDAKDYIVFENKFCFSDLCLLSEDMRTGNIVAEFSLESRGFNAEFIDQAIGEISADERAEVRIG